MLRGLLDYFDVTLVCFHGQFAARPDNSLVHRLAGFTRVPYSNVGYFGLSRNLYVQARRAILGSRPDVILADVDKSGLYARLLGWQFGIPYVYSSHNVAYQRFLSLARTNALRYPFIPVMYFAERLCAGGAATTITITEPDAAVFRRLAPGANVVSLPMAFDEHEFHPGEPDVKSGAPVVLMVGNFSYPPNLEAARSLFENVVRHW